MSTECLWYVLHWDRTSYRCVSDLSDWGVCQCGVERCKAPSIVNGPSCCLVQTFVCLRISGALYVVVHCIYTVSKLESFIRKDDTITMFVCKVASVLFIALIYTFTGVVFAYSNRFCLSVCMSVPDIIHIVCVVDRDNLWDRIQDNCILSQIDISLCLYAATFLTNTVQ